VSLWTRIKAAWTAFVDPRLVEPQWIRIGPAEIALGAPIEASPGVRIHLTSVRFLGGVIVERDAEGWQYIRTMP
jgi:hypothetical protein